jgi:hypothetical protein
MINKVALLLVCMMFIGYFGCVFLGDSSGGINTIPEIIFLTILLSSLGAGIVLGIWGFFDEGDKDE